MAEIFPFGGKYLKVLTPRTTNGVIPEMDENNVAQFKETHLPLTARTYLEKQNDGLPKHLHHRITVMDSDTKKIDTEMQEVLDKKKTDLDKVKKDKADKAKKDKADPSEIDEDILT